MPRAAVARAEPEPRWANLAEAAAYMRLTPRTIRRWIDDGLLPSATRVGPKLIQVDLNDLDRLRRRLSAAAAQLAAVDSDGAS